VDAVESIAAQTLKKDNRACKSAYQRNQNARSSATKQGKYSKDKTSKAREGITSCQIKFDEYMKNKGIPVEFRKYFSNFAPAFCGSITTGICICRSVSLSSQTILKSSAE
jgi:hypothetical protein